MEQVISNILPMKSYNKTEVTLQTLNMFHTVFIMENQDFQINYLQHMLKLMKKQQQ